MGASRREAADRFEVSVSSAVKWLQRWHESKSAAPKRRGGSVSPLEARTEDVLTMNAAQPDLTLIETVEELRKRRIRTSRSALSRFYARHDITFKKKPAGRRTTSSRRGSRATALDPGARYA
jgi:transposase